MIIFSQRDPQWADLTLGNGEATIGSDGCYLTVYAMILGQIPGVAITPKNLNDKLKEAGRFYYSLMASDAAIDGMFGAHYVETKWEPNAADLHYPQDPVTEQYAIEIFINGNPNQTHFVLYYDGHTNEDIRVVDPWNGDICYLTRYGQPETIIQKWVHYTIPGTPVAPPVVAPAPGLDLTPPAPVPVEVAPEPTESVLNNEPEYKATYQPKEYEVTTTIDGFAIDMTSQGSPISIAENTLIEVVGIFTDNGKSYVRSKKSLAYDNAHGTWYGLTIDTFATGQNSGDIPVTVITPQSLNLAKLLATLLSPFIKLISKLKGTSHA